LGLFYLSPDGRVVLLTTATSQGIWRRTAITAAAGVLTVVEEPRTITQLRAFDDVVGYLLVHCHEMFL
jgi:hypothetical protein